MIHKQDIDSKTSVCKEKEKSDSFLKVLGLSVGLIFASPMIAFCAFFAFVCVTAFAAFFFGAFHASAPWIFLIALATCLGPAIRDRVSGKYNLKKLELENDILHARLLEAKQQILALEEGLEFHQKLQTASAPEKSVSTDKINTTIQKDANVYIPAPPASINIAKN